MEAEIDLFNLPALFGNDPRCGLGGLRFLRIQPFQHFIRPLIDREVLLKNLQRVQERSELDTDAKLLPEDYYSPTISAPLNFSVEMETGTGKTYVYLRTIFELNKKYGFKKFIIVVPSVAIREGVLKNLEITSEHFKALYNNVEYEYFVYDAKKVNRLRQFAVSNQIQILVINIDAFNKKVIAVIHKEADKLSGRKPIEFVCATNPIVIIDEPQSVDNTPKAQEARQPRKRSGCSTFSFP